MLWLAWGACSSLILCAVCGWLGARAAVLSCVLCVAGLGRVQQSYPVCCDWLGARAAVLSCVL
ncbi:hypothetical protein B9T07_22135 [Limnospira fusiformis CCALA 023]